jgi:hypothetical protein
MEKSIAVKKLSKIIGKGFGYQLNSKAADKEGREAAKAQMKDAVAERNRLSEEMEARRKAILAGDQEFQTRLVAYRAARKHVNDLSGIIHSHRITVGFTNSVGGFGFFHVKAQGDNWDDVVEKVTNGK